MFKNMKIGLRLSLSFGVVGILLIVIVFFGISRLKDLDENIEKIVNDRFPEIELSHAIIDDLNQIARSMRNLVIFTDSKMLKEQLAKIEKSKAIIKENIKKLEAYKKTPRGTELFQSVLDARTKYELPEDEFLRLQKNGKTEEMKGLLIGQLNYLRQSRRLIR